MKKKLFFLIFLLINLRVITAQQFWVGGTMHYAAQNDDCPTYDFVSHISIVLFPELI